MEKEKLLWLQQMIRNNNMHGFYSSREWQRAAARARDRQHNECQRCKMKGYYSPCEIVHHIRPVKQNPEMALADGNLECLCRNCHEEVHHRQVYRNRERW